MQFTYTGETERDYSDIDGSALHAIPGKSYELSTAPDDGRWSPQYPVTPPEPPVTPPSTTGA